MSDEKAKVLSAALLLVCSPKNPSGPKLLADIDELVQDFKDGKLRRLVLQHGAKHP